MRPKWKTTLKNWAALKMKMGMDKAQTHTTENDTDDEMDTTEIEEENWIDYIKRSTKEAIDKMDDA